MMKFLVPCKYLVASGGLLRFERIGAALRRVGHTLTFVPTERSADFETECAVVTPDEANEVTWDATLIPGAGFPPETIQGMRRLRARNYGVRVQMVLNDQHVRERFLAVNNAFDPDIVVFNSEHWPPGSYRDFAGRRFHHLVGAVDTSLFHPALTTTYEGGADFVIGAQLAKNPEPLLNALDILPSNFRIRFFGFDRNHVQTTVAARFGSRVEFVGPLFGADLAAYYSNLHAMVSTEERAGWANVVAEAMASGVPVITTRAGTLSIARHDDTALVIDQPTPALIASAASKLRNNPNEARRLTTNARAHILHFDWTTYTDRLLQIVQTFDGSPHYTYAPDLGLYGKATKDERLSGLEDLLALAPATETVLDLGAAEGLIANEFKNSGSKRVDAYELEPGRVAEALRLFSQPGLNVQTADLSKDEDVDRIISVAPAAGYDLVLYLGVHQHLPEGRMKVLIRLVAVAKKILAIRTPALVFEADRMESALRASGFVKIWQALPADDSFAGPLYVFERAHA